MGIRLAGILASSYWKYKWFNALHQHRLTLLSMLRIIPHLVTSLVSLQNGHVCSVRLECVFICLKPWTQHWNSVPNPIFRVAMSEGICALGAKTMKTRRSIFESIDVHHKQIHQTDKQGHRIFFFSKDIQHPSSRRTFFIRLITRRYKRQSFINQACFSQPWRTAGQRKSSDTELSCAGSLMKPRVKWRNSGLQKSGGVKGWSLNLLES